MQREPDSINFIRPGWIEAAGMRMSLVDIKAGFYELREVISREVGETEDDVVYHAGMRSALSFSASAMDAGMLTPDEAGYRGSVRLYSEAGFGNFEIAELFWPNGWAVIRCNDTSEGWAYVQNQNLQSRAKCDYSRGVLAAFMSVTHKRGKTGIEEVFAVESTCIGKGDAECEFLVGTRADLEARGYEIGPPKPTVREKLERTVTLLRDANKRLMNAEMQYRTIFDTTFDSIMIIDRDLGILHCNRPAEQFLGAQRVAVTGRKISEYIPLRQTSAIDEKVEEALQLSRPVEFHADVVTASGESKACHIRVYPIHGDLAVVFHAVK